jgi:DNA ligase-1
VLQIGWAALRDAMCAAAGVDQAMVYQVYLKHSDLGETVAEILEHHAVASSLSIEDVGDAFKQLSTARGPLAKTPILAKTLTRCTPVEAKYLVKIITGDLRIGLKEGLVEEAIASAFVKPADEVRRANLLLGDVGKTALLAAESRLGDTELVPFRPVKFMLASPEETAADVFERVQESARTSATILGNQLKDDSKTSTSSEIAEPSAPHPAWVEDKYDGIRCQLHKVGGRVALYSRDLKEITSTFLELADSVRGLSEDFILDGEIVAMRGDEVLPFA